VSYYHGKKAGARLEPEGTALGAHTHMEAPVEICIYLFKIFYEKRVYTTFCIFH
jgi:hypothetical protein